MLNFKFSVILIKMLYFNIFSNTSSVNLFSGRLQKPPGRRTRLNSVGDEIPHSDDEGEAPTRRNTSAPQRRSAASRDGNHGRPNPQRRSVTVLTVFSSDISTFIDQIS